MRLLVIAPSAYLLGGVQDWLYMLAMELRKRGHHVVVAVPDNKFHNVERFNQYFKGINAISFVNRTGTSQGRITAIERLLLSNHADIVLGVNIGDVYRAFWKAKERLKQSKLVMSIHAIEANYFADIKEYSLVLDAVITTNKLTELLVRNMGVIAQERIYYAPYGIDEINTVGMIHQGTNIRIAWVGRVEEQQKRVSDLQHILIALDKSGVKYTLSIAGDGPCLNNLKNQLSTWVDSGKACFWGFVRKEQMSNFYSNHNILLITSRWETGPIVAWEAMASGLAVVSSKYVGSKAEQALIHNKTALLYSVGDQHEAVEQIQRLSDPLLREIISNNGRKLANTRYSANASVTAWEAAFKAIMNQQVLEKPMMSKEIGRANGRLESFLGTYLSEKIRHVFPPKVTASDAGGEWPHSLQGEYDQTFILKAAEEAENRSDDTRSLVEGLDSI